MFSKYAVYVKAVSALGENPSPSLEDVSQSTELFNAHYELERAQCLADFDWEFAHTFKRLTAAQVSDGERYPWAYAWHRPEDQVGDRFSIFNGLNVNDADHSTGVQLWPVDPRRRDIQRYNFQRRRLWYFSNVEPVTLEYTQDVPIEEWPVVAVQYLAYSIASAIAQALTDQNNVQATMDQKRALLATEAFHGSVFPPRAASLTEDGTSFPGSFDFERWVYLQT